MHIIQRGNNRKACFFADDDAQFLVEHLAESAKPVIRKSISFGW